MAAKISAARIAPFRRHAGRARPVHSAARAAGGETPSLRHALIARSDAIKPWRKLSTGSDAKADNFCFGRAMRRAKVKVALCGSGSGMVNGRFMEVEKAKSEAASRQKVEADLLRATALLKAIGEISSDPIYAKDVDGRFFYANPAALAIIGKSASDVLGHTDLEFHSDPEQAAIIMANDRRIMRGPGPEVIEETWNAAGVGAQTYKSTKTPLYRDDGSLIGIMCLSADITAARAAREASQLRQGRQISESAWRDEGAHGQR